MAVLYMPVVFYINRRNTVYIWLSSWCLFWYSRAQLSYACACDYEQFTTIMWEDNLWQCKL